jgi:hypothetical protein
LRPSPAKNIDRPPLRCLAAFLPLEVLPALLRSLLEVVPGVTALPRDGAAAAGVLGARLDPCRHHMTEQGKHAETRSFVAGQHHEGKRYWTDITGNTQPPSPGRI